MSEIHAIFSAEWQERSPTLDHCVLDSIVSTSKGGQRLTIVQYAGDFREASLRLNAGGAETYGSQRYTVEYVERLASRLDAVTTITLFTPEPFDVRLPSGARAIGAGFRDRIHAGRLAKLIEGTRPNLLILRAPIWSAFRWAARNRCRTLILLADSIDPRSLRGRLRWWLLAHYMRNPIFDVVANHGRNAARQLVQAGVAASKVLAWDFPQQRTPRERQPKYAPSERRELIYVGALSKEKGVTDLLDAVRLLSARGLQVRLTLVGVEKNTTIRDRVAELKLGSQVEFKGRVSNDLIVPMMAEADLVIVPSRHVYPEGLPLTIYEGFCSRTPIVASDHPMFLGNIVHEESGLLFRSGDAEDLANQIFRLLNDTKLYGRLSSNAVYAWDRLQLPVTWSDLIDRWLDPGPEAKQWLRDHSISRMPG